MAPPAPTTWRATARYLLWCANVEDSGPATIHCDKLVDGVSPSRTFMQHSHIAIIGAPLDLGQDRRGVDMGPSAIRVANLNKRLAALGYHVDDLGNVPVDQPESLPEGPD